jgi:hypothetical protein
MTLLKKGHGIKLQVANTTILKINNVQHRVDIDNVGISYVDHLYSSLLPEISPTMLHHQDRNMTSLLFSVSPAPCLALIHILDTSDSSSDSSKESRHDTKVTMRLLLDLLTNSIAIMSIDNNIDE